MIPEPIFCSRCGRRLIERASRADSSQVFLTCPRIWGFWGEFRELFGARDHTDVATGRSFAPTFDPYTGERMR